MVKPNRTETRFASGDLDDDKLLCMEALKAWAKKIEGAEVKKPMIYGLIWSHLSPESMDEVKQHKGYKVFGPAKDPEAL